MATREEIIEGLEFTVFQAKRTTALYAADEWDAKRDSGWTPKEIYCHLAGTAGIVPGFAQGMMAAPEDQDLAAGVDINALNDKAVAGMSSMTPEQVMQAFEASYDKLIEFVQGVPDDLLNSKRRFLSESIPVSDIVASSIMLHGIHHVYEANTRPIG
jgi:hypothetical protein